MSMSHVRYPNPKLWIRMFGGRICRSQAGKGQADGQQRHQQQQQKQQRQQQGTTSHAESSKLPALEQTCNAPRQLHRPRARRLKGVVPCETLGPNFTMHRRLPM